jgi:hypothetical protein
MMALLVNVLVLGFGLWSLGRVSAAIGLLAAEVLTAAWAVAAVRRRIGALGLGNMAAPGAVVVLAVGIMLTLPGRLGAVPRLQLSVVVSVVAIVFVLLLGPGRDLRNALQEPAA